MVDMEWILAQQWVISTGVAENKRSIQPSEHLRDFAVSLRDGVVLCGIANFLKPYCIEYTARKVQNIDQHEFLCKRNITLFLRTCKDVFHLKSKDLFTTSDLYDLTNFVAVVNTLSVLSHHKSALAIQGCRPFTVVNLSKRCKVEDHHIYGSLAEEIDEEVLLTTGTDIDNDIYGEENYVNSAYDTLIYNSPAPLQTAPLEKTIASKRHHIIKEILETEEGYMKLLRTIVQSYIPALRTHTTVEDERTVFLNINEIYTLHLNFFRELSTPQTQKSRSTTNADISAFTRYKKRFLIYAYYCTHLDESQRRVDQLLKKPGFRNTVEQLNAKLQRKVILKGQLCVCFQRVLKYPLLLTELLKNTPEGHKEHLVVKNALVAMEDVACYINEFKRDQEIVSEISHIQKSLKFHSALSGKLESLKVEFGRHLRDGELQVQFEGEQNREKRVVFLFEKALLLCKVNGVFNEVHDIICLTRLKVKDSQPSWKGRYSKEPGKFSHCFTLSNKDDDCDQTIRNCRIFTKTEHLKRCWIDDIRNCIRVVTLSEHKGKTNNHSFQLTTFRCDECPTCDVCQKLFLGQVSQGYLCQNGDCQLRTHIECLQKCRTCQYLSLKSEAVTTECISKNKENNQRDQTIEETIALTMSHSSTNQSEHEDEHFAMSPTPSIEGSHWFSGPLSRDQSEDLLTGFPNGSFLIRENKYGVLAMSIQCNSKTFHIKIKEQSGHYYLSDTLMFRTIEDMIAYYQDNSLVYSFPQLCTILTKLIRNTYL